MTSNADTPALIRIKTDYQTYVAASHALRKATEETATCRTTLVNAEMDLYEALSAFTGTRAASLIH